MERLRPDSPERKAPPRDWSAWNPDDDQPGVLPLIRLEDGDVVFQLMVESDGAEGLLRIRCTADGGATMAIAGPPESVWRQTLRRLQRGARDLARQALAAVTNAHHPSPIANPDSRTEPPRRQR